MIMSDESICMLRPKPVYTVSEKKEGKKKNHEKNFIHFFSRNKFTIYNSHGFIIVLEPTFSNILRCRRKYSFDMKSEKIMVPT